MYDLSKANYISYESTTTEDGVNCLAIAINGVMQGYINLDKHGDPVLEQGSDMENVLKQMREMIQDKNTIVLANVPKAYSDVELDKFANIKKVIGDDVLKNSHARFIDTVELTQALHLNINKAYGGGHVVTKDPVDTFVLSQVRDMFQRHTLTYGMSQYVATEYVVLRKVLNNFKIELPDFEKTPESSIALLREMANPNTTPESWVAGLIDKAVQNIQDNTTLTAEQKEVDISRLTKNGTDNSAYKALLDFAQNAREKIDHSARLRLDIRNPNNICHVISKHLPTENKEIYDNHLKEWDLQHNGDKVALFNNNTDVHTFEKTLYDDYVQPAMQQIKPVAIFKYVQHLQNTIGVNAVNNRMSDIHITEKMKNPAQGMELGFDKHTKTRLVEYNKENIATNKEKIKSAIENLRNYQDEGVTNALATRFWRKKPTYAESQYLWNTYKSKPDNVILIDEPDKIQNDKDVSMTLDIFMGDPKLLQLLYPNEIRGNFYTIDDTLKEYVKKKNFIYSFDHVHKSSKALYALTSRKLDVSEQANEKRVAMYDELFPEHAHLDKNRKIQSIQNFVEQAHIVLNSYKTIKKAYNQNHDLDIFETKAESMNGVYSYFPVSLELSGASTGRSNKGNTPVVSSLNYLGLTAQEKACLHPKDYVNNAIVEADSSNLELRVAAAILNNDTLNEVYRQGKDIYLYVGLLIDNKIKQIDMPDDEFNIRYDELCELKKVKDGSEKYQDMVRIRELGKPASISILYGVGKDKLCERMGVEPDVAESIKKQVLDKYNLTTTLDNLNVFLNNIKTRSNMLDYVRTTPFPPDDIVRKVAIAGSNKAEGTQIQYLVTPENNNTAKVFAPFSATMTDSEHYLASKEQRNKGLISHYEQNNVDRENQILFSQSVVEKVGYPMITSTDFALSLKNHPEMQVPFFDVSYDTSSNDYRATDHTNARDKVYSSQIFQNAVQAIGAMVIAEQQRNVFFKAIDEGITINPAISIHDSLAFVVEKGENNEHAEKAKQMLEEEMSKTELLTNHGLGAEASISDSLDDETLEESLKNQTLQQVVEIEPPALVDDFSYDVEAIFDSPMETVEYEPEPTIEQSIEHKQTQIQQTTGFVME